MKTRTETCNTSFRFFRELPLTAHRRRKFPLSYFRSSALRALRSFASFALRILHAKDRKARKSSRHFDLPHSIRQLRRFNLHFQKLPDHFDVRRCVTRKRQCSETSSTSHRHRNQQLIREVLR